MAIAEFAAGINKNANKLIKIRCLLVKKDKIAYICITRDSLQGLSLDAEYTN